MYVTLLLVILLIFICFPRLDKIGEIAALTVSCILIFSEYQKTTDETSLNNMYNYKHAVHHLNIKPTYRKDLDDNDIEYFMGEREVSPAPLTPARLPLPVSMEYDRQAHVDNYGKTKALHELTVHNTIPSRAKVKNEHSKMWGTELKDWDSKAWWD